MGDFAWPDNARCAISLVLDRLESAAVSSVLAQLRRTGHRATFAVNPTEVLRDVPAWVAVGAAGHEIANGCLSDATDNGELENWTPRTVEQELFMAQMFLDDMYPEQETRTFLYPGASTNCSGGSYRPIVEASYPIGVTKLMGLNPPGANPRALLSTAIDEEPESQWAIYRLENLFDLCSIDTGFAWVAPVCAVVDYLASRA